MQSTAPTTPTQPALREQLEAQLSSAASVRDRMAARAHYWQLVLLTERVGGSR